MSFNPTLMTAIDRVRFAVGDVQSAELLPDDTYAAILAGFDGDERKTTLQIAEFLIVRYAQEPDKVDLDGGKTSAAWSERIKAWRRLADQIRAEFAQAVVTTQGGGAGTRRVSRFDDGRGSEYRRPDECLR